MKYYSINEVKSWDRFYRANFINCLQGFKPVSLIGTLNETGQYNLGIFSNIIHIGADPALVGFINRPLEAAPHTIRNIEISGVYTINHIHPLFIDGAHQTSAKYPAEINEFEAVGLHSIIKEDCRAPFVAESVVQYALKLVEIVPITHNNSFLVIGAITHVFLEESLVQEDGFIDLEKGESVTSLGLDGYYSTSFIGRYEYAKPGTVPRKKNG